MLPTTTRSRILLESSDGAGIRSILNDHDLYAATVFIDDSGTTSDVVDAIIGAMGFYKGIGLSDHVHHSAHVDFPPAYSR
jgi:ribosome-interacting GTPase 1